MKEFELNGREYIELNKLLKFMGLVDTGGEANDRIVNGEVLLNNAVEIQKRKKVRPGDKVLYDGNTIVIKE